MAENGADFEQRLRDANEQLYKHSHDLAVRNKTLSLLRQLYQISILTIEPQPLAEKIVKIVREELEFDYVSVMRVDGNALAPLATDLSPRLIEAVKAAGQDLSTMDLPDAANMPFFKELFSGRENHTKELSEVWGNRMGAAALAALSSSGHVKEVSAHPLLINRKFQGVLLIGLNRELENLSQFEQDSIESLVDVTAVALDRARVYEELQQANEHQVMLIHFITHQIKGFVTKSRNLFSMLLEGDYGPIPETMKPMIEEGFRSDTKGVNTIQEILNAANIKSGKVTYAKTPINIKELVESIVHDLKPAADTKGLELKVTASDGDYVVEGDRMQLTNAFKNLIDNAVKYTLKGSVDVTLTHEAGRVRLVVADTGVGITPEDMTVLFTEGGHGKESSRLNVESTGFGLYIVKNIIEAHNGKVWAESEGKGKGSKFIAELPVS